MAKKSKKNVAKAGRSKPKKAVSGGWKPEKEEKIKLSSVARDERTWKIFGAFCLIISLISVHCLYFLFLYLERGPG